MKGQSEDRLVGSGTESDEFGLGPDTDEENAGHKTRTCTDPLCLVVLVAAFVPIYWILQYATEPGVGDIRRLYHGYDFIGNLCGVDSKTSFVWNNVTGTSDNVTETSGGFLFWCKDSTGLTVDLAHPVCVSSCPTAADVAAGSVTSCYVGDVKVPVPVAGAAAGTFAEQITYQFELKPDYETAVFAYRYCMPKDPALMEAIMAALKQSYAQSLIMDLWGVLGAWLPLLLSAFLALILGYAYLFIIKVFAAPLVYGCLAILTLAPLGIGGYFIFVTYSGGADGIPSTGDSNLDYTAGLAMVILGVGLGALSCCAGHAIDVAIRCVQAACKCMFDMKSLLLEPLIALIFKAGLLGVMGYGFLWVLSTGEMSKETLQQYVAAEVPGMQVHGIMRSFSYNEEQMKMMAYYIFMMFWMAELSTALSHFVLAYSTQLWYFTKFEDGKKNAPRFPICKGYLYGVQYHLGSIAFGSFIVAMLRMIRLIMGWIARKMDSQGNAVGSCIAKCVLCCITCFQRFIEFVNKNAYMDIACNSNHFLVAAKNALTIIAGQIAEIGVLNGATWIFQFAGVGAITSAGTYLTLLMIRNMETFTQMESSHYIAEPIAVVVVAGVICFLISVAFMLVFDTVADTILYCFATEKIRRQKGELLQGDQYAPSGLNALVKGDGGL